MAEQKGDSKDFHKVDMRKKDFSELTHVFYTEEIETIETYGKDSDIKVQLLNGTRYIFRCSCCVLFTGQGTKISIS